MADNVTTTMTSFTKYTQMHQNNIKQNDLFANHMNKMWNCNTLYISIWTAWSPNVGNSHIKVLKYVGTREDFNTSSYRSSTLVAVIDWQGMTSYQVYVEPLLSYKPLKSEEQ